MISGLSHCGHTHCESQRRKQPQPQPPHTVAILAQVGSIPCRISVRLGLCLASVFFKQARSVESCWALCVRFGMLNLSCEFQNFANDEIPGPPSARLSSWSLGIPPCCGRFGVVMELFYMADEVASSSVKFDVMVKLVERVSGFCCGDARCGRCHGSRWAFRMDCCLFCWLRCFSGSGRSCSSLTGFLGSLNSRCAQERVRHSSLAFPVQRKVNTQRPSPWTLLPLLLFR